MQLINLTRKLIREYFEKVNPDQEDNNQLEQMFYENLKKEIIDQEIDNIKLQIRKENEKTKTLENIRRIKIFLFESMVLALLISLMSNQLTGLINILKNESNFILISLVIILCILVIILIFVFIVYLNKIETIFIKKEK